ncbi:hypothetical protein GGI15_001449 [Coemansia interrupta]|uniref:Alpha/beta hydrolase fold-3 domain-containing protein n=1 Tax=Coemansia interrupta TaxID=1126814 RepID=A0A9W8LLD9_9FUNG|nr:hypothetical protein GGI15_001449 [Coemansia interrupta]
MLTTFLRTTWETVHGVAVVVRVAVQAVFGRRLDEAWDWRTQASRDLLVRWSTDPQARRGLMVLSGVLGWAQQHVPPLQTHTCVELMATQAYLVDAPMVLRCGRWGARLQAMSLGPQMPLPVDLIESTRTVINRRRVGLLLHGGAYVTGGRTEYRALAVRLSRELGLPVYVAEYRLAPGTRYPGQLYDALRALGFLADQGYAASSVVLIGDSAGGNLALALWQATRASFLGMLLMSPRVDVVSRQPSWSRNMHRDILPPFTWNAGPLAMLLRPEDRVEEDGFLAPVHANWSGAPRMLVQAGTGEVMLDDVRAFVRRAAAEGVHVVYAEYEGAFHVFQAAPLGAVGAAGAWRQAGDFVRALG